MKATKINPVFTPESKGLAVTPQMNQPKPRWCFLSSLLSALPCGSLFPFPSLFMSLKTSLLLRWTHPWVGPKAFDPLVFSSCPGQNSVLPFPGVGGRGFPPLSHPAPYFSSLLGHLGHPHPSHTSSTLALMYFYSSPHSWLLLYRYFCICPFHTLSSKLL